MDENRIEGAARKGFGRVQDALGGLTGDAKTQAQGKLNQAAGSVQDVFGQARDWAQDYFDMAEDFARDQPLAALAAAIGAGVVLGLVLGGGKKTVYVRR